MRTSISLLLLIALSVAPSPGIREETKISGFYEGSSFGVVSTQVKSQQPGINSVGLSAKKSPSSPIPKSATQVSNQEAVVVSSGGYEEFEAVLSSGCFDPADYTYQCVNDGVVDPEIDPADPVRATAPISQAQFQDLVYREFASLPLTGSGLVHQPQGEAIIGLDFILFTDPAPVSNQERLFDVPVTIRATPVHYLWDLGDGGTISTTDPGKSFPDQTVTYLYEEAGTYTVTLTTTWVGHYSTGQTWHPIAGTITTTETSEPITHKKYRTVLIPPPND